jgi:DNA-directed RNA polymerase subunit RPC12/RpoP
MSTGLLFAKSDIPRRQPIKRMHVIDAGMSDMKGCQWLEFKCSRCGYKEQGHYTETVTEAKRGLPCPKCNENGKYHPSHDLYVSDSHAYDHKCRNCGATDDGDAIYKKCSNSKVQEPK